MSARPPEARGEWARRLGPVVFGTDFSEPCEKALVHAVRHAKATGVPLHIVHVQPLEPDNYKNHPHWDHSPSTAEQKLDALKADVERYYQPLTACVVTHRSEGEGLLDYAARQQAGLIVIGTHGHGRVAEAFLGSHAQYVVKNATVPVLAVPYRCEDKHRPGVLAAVDLTATAKGVIRQAAELAVLLRGPLVVLHVADGSHAAATLHTAVEKRVASAGESAEVVIGDGPAAATILDTAKRRDAGLVVIAASKRRSKVRLANGVAGKVLRGARCPVLVYR